MRLPLAALGVALSLWALPAWASGTIRVAVVEQARVVELRGVGIDVAALGSTPRGGRPWRADAIRAVPAAQGVEIDGRQAAGFRLTSAAPMRLNGRDYPAVLDVVRSGDGLAVVNEVPLEAYVAGVLRGETGERWPAEALRAQAVVVRTYAVHARRLAAGRAYHLVASTQHQVYAGLVDAASPVRAATLDTAGQVLLWEGAPFPAFYHADSGGFTEEPRAVFAARNLPMLRPVTCDFSSASPHATWALDLPVADLAAALRRGGVDVGTVTAVEVSERSWSLRAAAVTVRGSAGAARLRGNDFRRMLGYDTLRSTLFAVVVADGTARFVGRGYGHGVGLSQWGARGMAELGYTAAQILAHYYPGAVLAVLDGG